MRDQSEIWAVGKFWENEVYGAIREKNENVWKWATHHFPTNMHNEERKKILKKEEKNAKLFKSRQTLARTPTQYIILKNIPVNFFLVVSDLEIGFLSFKFISVIPS